MSLADVPMSWPQEGYVQLVIHGKGNKGRETVSKTVDSSTLERVRKARQDISVLDKKSYISLCHLIHTLLEPFISSMLDDRLERNTVECVACGKALGTADGEKVYYCMLDKTSGSANPALTQVKQIWPFCFRNGMKPGNECYTFAAKLKDEQLVSAEAKVGARPSLVSP